MASDSVRVLHDRRIPGRRANIDHLVITEDAVWVIDAKRYKGGPSLRVEGGILRPRTETLVVAGRNQTKLVTGVNLQVEKVAAAVPGVFVRGMLCFVDADWPLIGGDFTIGGVHVCWPNRIAKTLTTSSGAHLDVDMVTAELTARFRSA